MFNITTFFLIFYFVQHYYILFNLLFCSTLLHSFQYFILFNITTFCLIFYFVQYILPKKLNITTFFSFSSLFVYFHLIFYSTLLFTFWFVLFVLLIVRLLYSLQFKHLYLSFEISVNFIKLKWTGRVLVPGESINAKMALSDLQKLCLINPIQPGESD